MENPEQARQFIRDCVRVMRERAWNENSDGHGGQQEGEDSLQKKMYGDTWTFMYGIVSGMDKMKQGKDVEYNWETKEEIDHGASDRQWQEHYDKYGHGAYGRGLEIGKRLAFYSGSDFSFVEPEEDEGPNFTFVQ